MAPAHAGRCGEPGWSSGSSTQTPKQLPPLRRHPRQALASSGRGRREHASRSRCGGAGGGVGHCETRCAWRTVAANAESAAAGTRGGRPEAAAVGAIRGGAGRGASRRTVAAERRSRDRAARKLGAEGPSTRPRTPGAGAPLSWIQDRLASTARGPRQCRPRGRIRPVAEAEGPLVPLAPLATGRTCALEGVVRDREPREPGKPGEAGGAGDAAARVAAALSAASGGERPALRPAARSAGTRRPGWRGRCPRTRVAPRAQVRRDARRRPRSRAAAATAQRTGGSGGRADASRRRGGAGGGRTGVGAPTPQRAGAGKGSKVSPRKKTTGDRRGARGGGRNLLHSLNRFSHTALRTGAAVPSTTLVPAHA